MHIFSLLRSEKKFYFEPLLKNTVSSFVYILPVELFILLNLVLQITLDDKIASFRVFKTRLVYF